MESSQKSQGYISECDIVVTRADGFVENYGNGTYYHTNPVIRFLGMTAFRAKFRVLRVYFWIKRRLWKWRLTTRES